MISGISIRILEKDNNRRGDLFGRLMADLFVALGYEQPRLNVHKSGRELDLSADHRLEPRRAVAECKAELDPIGGGDVNKFVGALDAERKGKRPTTGYFISLSGFKETAIEQEKQGRRTKIVTLTGPQVVGELVEGRILIPQDRATELAGRLASKLDQLILDPETELLAHERGWIWAVYYTQGKARTHIALIHSDGTPLARVLADEVIAADKDVRGRLHALACLNPGPLPEAGAGLEVDAALVAYRQYLTNECGFIQLDGLPADSDVGSRRMRLESLFVPLHLDVALSGGVEARKMERQAVGAVLASHPRLAILAAPGGGKSTLLKRLAVAYADPARQGQTADDLPKRDWLPLFFRCRELRDLARGSFADLLDALSQREPVRQHAGAFLAEVDRALLAGRVLLLVDGLDEISDAGDRAAFVCTLRAALQAYPGTGFVVTSREAGFRHVAAHLAPICTQATLSTFDGDDIRRLSVAWHREVVGDTEKVRSDAKQLAATIAGNDRIRRLATNPLLLTTLLLVKRWVGSLPTGRAALYGKAVEVLLMTWNTEGFEPIVEGEALPQLCYVASAMMLEGVQKVSRPRLAALLQEARDALPTELGYVRGTVEEFIERVEYRSSLLMMTGLDVENGRLVEFFEFRHLTFQEFLTARAMVEGWHPGRQERDTLADALEPHFEEEAWREVIPLAAVLGGRETEGIIQRLTERVRGLPAEHGPPEPALHALANCLADEAAARPETIQAAIREIVLLGTLLEHEPFMRALAQGRYGPTLREEAGRAFVHEGPGVPGPRGALAIVVWWQTVASEDVAGLSAAAQSFEEMLGSEDRLARCEGALGLMHLCWRLVPGQLAQPDAIAEAVRRGGRRLPAMIMSGDLWEQVAATWAFVWFGESGVAPVAPAPELVVQLFALWRHSPNEKLREFSCWALGTQPVGPRDESSAWAAVSQDDVENLLEGYEDLDEQQAKPAALVIAWYRRVLDDAELARRARELVRALPDFFETPRVPRELLERLGEIP